MAGQNHCHPPLRKLTELLPKLPMHWLSIVTADHLHFAAAQHLSVPRHSRGHSFRHSVLVTDAPRGMPSQWENMQLYSLSALAHQPLALEIHKRYKMQPDRLRWSLKACWLAHNLALHNEPTVYIDPDIWFCGDWTSIYEQMENASVLLCPHWRHSRPQPHTAWFQVNLTDGVYNAGLIGANATGLAAMEWWAQCNAWNCRQSHANGLHDDQRYLDLIPAFFAGSKVLDHRGWNIAFWNLPTADFEHKNNTLMLSAKRDEVYPPGEWPAVCIHWTKRLTEGLKRQTHPLQVHYAQWRADLEESTQRLKVNSALR